MIERVFWHIEGRVIGVHHSGSFDIAQPKRTMEVVEGIIQQSGKPPMVHVINHMNIETAGSAAFTRYQQMAETVKGYQRPARLGYFVVVAQHPPAIMRFIGSAAGQLIGLRLHLLGTMDQAIALIQDRDVTLSNAHFFPENEAAAIAPSSIAADPFS